MSLSVLGGQNYWNDTFIYRFGAMGAEIGKGIINCCSCKKRNTSEKNNDSLDDKGADLPDIEEALDFFFTHSGSVEFVRDKGLHRLRFP